MVHLILCTAFTVVAFGIAVLGASTLTSAEASAKGRETTASVVSEEVITRQQHQVFAAEAETAKSPQAQSREPLSDLLREQSIINTQSGVSLTSPPVALNRDRLLPPRLIPPRDAYGRP